jgi:peptide/bleomycin uptake transporter
MEAYLTRWPTNAPPIEGASQRIHEDTQRFASGVQSCVAALLDAGFTLAIFLPVLYNLDPVLMYVAFGTAFGGVGISAFVGQRLVGLEVNNQAAEAAFRRELVLLEVDALQEIGSPLSAFVRLIDDLKRNYYALYMNFAALSAWLGVFDQGATILPYLIVAPRLFAADSKDVLTLGALTQTANAFSKVFDSLNIVSDNWLAINEFRSVLRRLYQYEASIRAAQAAPAVELVGADDGVRRGRPGEWSKI